MAFAHTTFSKITTCECLQLANAGPPLESCTWESAKALTQQYRGNTSLIHGEGKLCTDYVHMGFVLFGHSTAKQHYIPAYLIDCNRQSILDF